MSIRLIRVFLFFLIALDLSAVCVDQSRANLRSKPSIQSTKTWEVYKYMPFKKLGSQGTWVKVKDVDGAVHWIHKRLITNKFKCAVVKVKNANLRTGPSTRSSIDPSWGKTEKYASFKYLKGERSWAYVMDEFGDKFWIYRPLIWVQ